MKIQLTTKSKIINPTDNFNNIYSFEGEFDQNIFSDNSPQSPYLKRQKVNMENLSNLLAQKNIFLTYIWMGTFINDNGCNANNFVIKSTINEQGQQIYWRKYATSNPGSGQNTIYIIQNDTFEKIQFYKFLKL